MYAHRSIQKKLFSKKILTLAIISVVGGASFPAFSQNSEQEALEEEIVITGFRSSLKQALDQKRDATGQVDAVIAEDIADFPDLNLAESLQRIPGVAITRENGEGKQITVRGLGGRYTMVRINGMETRAGDGSNSTRSFDFNMFASELFNNLIVRKTASANVGEGSLGAVVDLNTGRPFNYEEGNTFLVRGSLSNNSNSGDNNPRIAGLYAYNDPDGLWGVSASLAYSTTGIELRTGNTVRWHRTHFNSVNGVTCAESEEQETDAGCMEVRNAFHPRIPRYGTNIVEQDRLGATASFQFAPTDATEITFDAMFANLDRTRDFNTLEVLFRSNETGMDVTSYEIENEIERFPDAGVRGGNDSIVAMTVDNAWVRSERYHQEVESEYQQFTLALEQDFSDALRLKGLVGSSSNKGHIPVETTLMYDDRDYNGYSYRYRGSDDAFPSLMFNGPDVTDGSTYTLTEVRDQVQTVDTGFDTASIDLEWDFNDYYTLSGGIQYKKFTIEGIRHRRSGSVCGLGLYDCDTNNDGEDDLLGAPGTATLTDLSSYDGEVGAGTNTVWATPSLSGWTRAVDLYNVPLNIDEGNTRDVEEESLGAFIQINGEHELSNGMRFAYDFGVRYVETDQSSSGFNSGEWVTIVRPTYDDTLPAFNSSLWLSEELVVKASWAEVLARPALGNLSPGGSVDSFNRVVNFKNPFLDPSRATNFDLSIEWYFSEDSLLSLAYFNKDVESFALQEERVGTYASTGLPTSLIAPTSPASQSLEGDCGVAAGCWDISQLNNGPGAKIDGFELSTQFPLEVFSENLPTVMKGMGLIANYTYVNSDVTYEFEGASVDERLIGLSENQYNFTFYYENDIFGARISAAYRSEYYESGPDRSDNYWQIREPYLQYDFSSSYNFNDYLTFNLEVLNIFDDPFETLVDADAERRLESATTGRNILLSASYKF